MIFFEDSSSFLFPRLEFPREYPVPYHKPSLDIGPIIKSRWILEHLSLYLVTSNSTPEPVKGFLMEKDNNFVLQTKY